MSSSLLLQWDHDRQAYFYVDSKSGSRVYLKESLREPWRWDPERKEYYYMIHSNGSRMYSTWEWDQERQMYYCYTRDGSRTYFDGSHISHGDRSYADNSDGSRTYLDASYMPGMQPSAGRMSDSSKTHSKADPSPTSISDLLKSTPYPYNKNLLDEKYRPYGDYNKAKEKAHHIPRSNPTRVSARSRIRESNSLSSDFSSTIPTSGSSKISPPISDSEISARQNKIRRNETYTKSMLPSPNLYPLNPIMDCGSPPHYMPLETASLHNWKEIQGWLPVEWRWDVEYQAMRAGDGAHCGVWNCTPLEPDEPTEYPLTIAKAPVVLPVEYHCPPAGGVTPPPDPRPAAPIDSRAELSTELVKDLFLTFQGSIGFYVLIHGLLQVIVPAEYDTTWASSHLPHRYGGLKVCYIEQTLEPTMLPTRTETTGRAPDESSLVPLGTAETSPAVRASVQSHANVPSLKLNDFIEARPKSNHRNEKFSGRIGLKVSRTGIPLILMSTHVITEAILARSHRDSILGRKRDERIQKLRDDDWNEHVEIWAGGGKCGSIHQIFDKKAEFYPNGFNHDVTLIKPTSWRLVKDVASPVTGLGWLDQDSWISLRQQTTRIRILADAESSLSAKSIKCSRPSDILVVGEGIFLNQKAAAGNSKSLKHHDAATWKDLVSRAILYRVYPDFDPPNGHSGTALYADGTRTDGTEGPGVVGFQSFVQRSGHVQNFEMEGDALERRLRAGRVAFYGAFEVPAELKKYHIY